MPLPMPLTTPPVTNTYFVILIISFRVSQKRKSAPNMVEALALYYSTKAIPT